MNFQTMDYFVALAEERSFTRAAERLAVTQQTLSAHIAGVERELGVKLVRRTVPLTLTYAGQQFLGYARRFQAGERAMRREFKDISGNEQGLLGVGIASTRGHMLLPRVIARFQTEHPGISVLVREGENEELIAMLKEGRIDLAVATVPADEPGLVVRPLRSERIVLLATDGLLRSLLDGRTDEVIRQIAKTGDLSPLADCPFLMLGQGDEPGDLSRRLLERSGVRPLVRVQSKNSETLVDLAALGVGACFVPSDLADMAMRDHPDAWLRKVPLGPDAYIQIGSAWRESPHVWSMIEAFADVLERTRGAAGKGRQHG